MDQFEIAICGGGVGGLACALALIKAGHKVTVFERAEQFLRIGADVNLCLLYTSPSPRDS